MSASILQIVCLFAALGALAHSISVINVMSRRTSHFIRFVYCMLAVVSFGGVAFVIMGGPATLHGTIITLAIAGICLADRRRVGNEAHRSRECHATGMHR